jgi:hypothetical protein
VETPGAARPWPLARSTIHASRSGRAWSRRMPRCPPPALPPALPRPAPGRVRQGRTARAAAAAVSSLAVTPRITSLRT